MRGRKPPRLTDDDRRMGARFRDLRLRLRPELARHQDFADALHVTAQTVRNWENGRPIPDKMKRAICKLLGCQLADFYGAVSEWQTMNTAPRDGTEILVTMAYGETHIASWFEADPNADPDDPLTVEEAKAMSGWVTRSMRDLEPTKWMPLPPVQTAPVQKKAPAENAGAEEDR